MKPLRFAVIGTPIAHSKSPAMHAAAFAAMGLPHVYERIETSEHELAARVAALRDGTLAGLNVTVPHKTHVLALVDAIDASARATGAANTLVRTATGICAHNTDAPALVEELARLAGDRDAFRGKSAIVLGSGGAARAALFALGLLGAAHVEVRSRAQRPELASVLHAAHPAATLRWRPISTEIRGADVASVPTGTVAIVQATTAGMYGGAPGESVADAIEWDEVPPDAVALDVVYAPAETPFLARAAARGIRHDHGLGMLARQGALAFELWLGQTPPLDVMRAALQ